MILDRIIEHKKQELKSIKSLKSLNHYKDMIRSLPPTSSFIDSLDDSSIRLIAEIKKGSPSKGIIRADFNPVEIAVTYTNSGADAISVLTDEKFFFGHPDFLKAVRQVTSLPLLRKDFIIDPFQIYESRALGADLILLIAAFLNDETLTEFLSLASDLGMECLVEVHTEEELERVKKLPVKLLGINNRDLRSFKTDLQTTIRLLKGIAGSGMKIISESGINTKDDVNLLRQHGINGILVGESLMRETDIKGKILELLGLEGVA